MELIWMLEFGIWSFRAVGMGLFLKVVRKDPFVFRANYFERHLAIGTEDQIPWLLVSVKGDFGITDGTLQFHRHDWPPLVV